MKTLEADKKTSLLTARFGDAVATVVTPDGVLEVTVPAPEVAAALNYFRQEPAFDFHQLHDLTAVDYPQEGRMTVVYRLMNLERPEMMVLKVPLDRNRPEVATATTVWSAANWLEREVYDMFGVDFLGHPGLTRMLLWDEFEGHPLRKDFRDDDQSPPEVEYR